MTIAEIDTTFAGLAGETIEGGCDDCAAYQRVVQDSPGIWICRVHHETACPFWRGRQLAELQAVRKAMRRTGHPVRRAELAARAVRITEELNR